MTNSLKEKKIMDSYDDGEGPYLLALFEEDRYIMELWKEFLPWAEDSLACGISWACCDGHIIDTEADTAFKAYITGRTFKTD